MLINEQNKQSFTMEKHDYVTAKYASKNIDKIWFARFTNRLTQFTIQMKMFFKFNLTCKPTTDSHAFFEIFHNDEEMFKFAQSLPGYYDETRLQCADEQLHFLFLINNNLINKKTKT
jgi:hypothetical protein